ncbi:MAG: class I tRNA ligase family protein [Acidobacteriota bacterium]
MLHEASALIYQFIWHELCDWYIELVKPALTDASVPESIRTLRCRILIHVLDYALRILHPFMPFITEEIWQKIPHRGESIMIQQFPVPRKIRKNPVAAQKMQNLMELVGEVRSLRAEMNIDPRRLLDSNICLPKDDDKTLITRNLEKVRSLAGLGTVEFAEKLPEQMLRGVWRLGEFGLDIEGAINIAAERERLQKEGLRIREQIEKIEKKLDSPEFLSRAPDKVISENKLRYEELREKNQKIESNLKHLPVQ